MSAAEFAPNVEPRITAELGIAPPVGGAAINGFNRGVEHPFFPGKEYPPYAKLNGYEKPVAYTDDNLHFMIPGSDGELIIKRQTSADIVNTLEGKLETERWLRAQGGPVEDRRSALFVDKPDDNFINGVSFVGFELRKNEGTDRYESVAVFLHDSLPDDGQLTLDNQYIGVPLKEIVAILPSYNSENDLLLNS